MKKIYFVFIVVLTACGTQNPYEYRFETRELSQAELLQFGYGGLAGEDSLPPVDSVSVDEIQSQATTVSLVNAAAGIVQKLLVPGESKTVATLIGQAIPNGVKPFDLSKGKVGSHVYEKKLNGVLGFSVVKMHYKIGYQYAANYKGKGAYLTNVKFVPLRVETDVLWSLRAESLSEEPVNSGTKTNPNATLGFSLTFTAKGSGTRTVTDEFELEASSGKLTETVRAFEKE